MLADLIPFLLVCLTVELTPGPNMAYLAILTCSAGKRAGFAAVLGTVLGLAILGCVSLFGVSEILNRSPMLLRMLSYAGFFYLLWLAWETWSGEKQSQPQAHGMRHFHYFQQGMLTNIFNPKALLFFAVLIPGFTVKQEHALWGSVLFTATALLIAAVIHTIIVMMAGYWEPFLRQPERQQQLRRMMAILLIGVAVWFIA